MPSTLLNPTCIGNQVVLMRVLGGRYYDNHPCFTDEKTEVGNFPKVIEATSDEARIPIQTLGTVLTLTPARALPPRKTGNTV